MQYTGQDKMLVKRQKFKKLQIDAETSMFNYLYFLNSLI